MEAENSPKASWSAGSQNEVLLDNLMKFYSQGDNLDKLVSILNGESGISLRIVDWFATNYAKANDTSLHTRAGRRIKVHVDYKLHLRAYSKKRFDPFCRWVRLEVPYNEDTVVNATIGQLNFFKWALERGVVDYIEENRADVEKDMNLRNSTAKRKPAGTGPKTRKKREELSLSASRGVRRENMEVVVKFN